MRAGGRRRSGRRARERAVGAPGAAAHRHRAGRGQPRRAARPCCCRSAASAGPPATPVSARALHASSGARRCGRDRARRGRPARAGGETRPPFAGEPDGIVTLRNVLPDWSVRLRRPVPAAARAAGGARRVLPRAPPPAAPARGSPGRWPPASPCRSRGRGCGCSGSRARCPAPRGPVLPPTAARRRRGGRARVRRRSPSAGGRAARALRGAAVARGARQRRRRRRRRGGRRDRLRRRAARLARQPVRRRAAAARRAPLAVPRRAADAAARPWGWLALGGRARRARARARLRWIALALDPVGLAGSPGSSRPPAGTSRPWRRSRRRARRLRSRRSSASCSRAADRRGAPPRSHRARAGPAPYAGPGSLGGTESALRR